MVEKIKVLVIPDVHGRDFWREPVKNVLENTEARIVFLGDYVDPYPYEFEPDFDYKEHAIQGLEEIIQLKKDYPKRITLLLGNHDAGYRFSTEICDCRTDYRNYNKIQRLFQDNKELFQLADEAYINGKHFIFSHAGIHKGYLKYAFPSEHETINKENVVGYFNNGYLTEDKVVDTLGIYDDYRGWCGYDYGSIVWTDLRSWKDYDGFGYQVFGHTQLQHGCGGIIEEHFACLDSAEAFVITEKGNVKPSANVEKDDEQE